MQLGFDPEKYLEMQSGSQSSSSERTVTKLKVAQGLDINWLVENIVSPKVL